MAVEEIDVSSSDNKRSSMSNSCVTEVLKCLSIVLVVRGVQIFSLLCGTISVCCCFTVEAMLLIIDFICKRVTYLAKH